MAAPMLVMLSTSTKPQLTEFKPIILTALVSALLSENIFDIIMKSPSQILKTKFGYESFRFNQEEIIKTILQNATRLF